MTGRYWCHSEPKKLCADLISATTWLCVLEQGRKYKLASGVVRAIHLAWQDIGVREENEALGSSPG